MMKSINYYCPFSSDSWVAGAIVGAVFGFIVLITIIYICCQAGNCCCKSPKLYHRHRAINPVCKYISQSAINVCINYVLFSSLVMTAAIVCWSVCRIAWSEYLKISSIDTLMYPIKSRWPWDQSRSQNTGIFKSTLQSMSIYWESLSNHGRCIESRYRQNPGFALFIRSVLPWGLLRVCSKFALLIQSRPEQTQRTRSSAGVRFMLGCVWSEWYRIPRLSFWGAKVKGQGSY